MSSERKLRVLITFARSFLTLELCRLMAAGGHTVMVADSIPFGLSRFSNSTEKFFRVPPPKFSPGEYAQRLAEIVRDNDIDLLIPIHEETDIISMHRDLFPASCRLFLSDFETENRLHNKYEYQELLSERNIPALKYSLVRDRADAEKLDFTTPFALKQVYSRGSQKVHKMYPGDSFDDIEFDPDNPWLAQEWLKGDNYCTYSVCQSGEVLAHATYPVEYAIDGHSCVSFTQVEHEGILNWVRDFVREVNYTGQVGLDFIDNADRGLYTIECNPRSTSGILMFEPHNHVDRAFTGTSEGLVEPDLGVRNMVGPGMLIYGWRKSARPEGYSIWRFMRDYWHTDEVISNRHDPMPMLALPLALVSILSQSAKYHVGLAEGFMHDHEWDGEMPTGALTTEVDAATEVSDSGSGSDGGDSTGTAQAG
ncbi:ATP-grasp domain-containing protein [Gordonia jinhuaensis]|uniref:ATP-grasp domain-containing protein n=1 Tax=Gordonia jinhuaensis TaxID=1517702 RepID=A0A916THV1_9ACTN|nr:ATP-grasp domain-containing protein [Gordonia jinhuaensis]GGB45808.1 hypothetical protein GCM10011489_36490 [Gordonia jinhuaensis]